MDNEVARITYGKSCCFTSLAKQWCSAFVAGGWCDDRALTGSVVLGTTTVFDVDLDQSGAWRHSCFDYPPMILLVQTMDCR